jgi:lipoprotein-releasing system permease protein
VNAARRSYEWFIAFRYLRSKRRTRFVSIITYISIGGVLVGVAALIIVLSLFNGFESEVRERIIGARAHINVYSLYNEPMVEYEALIRRIRAMDHVVSAAPYIFEKAVCTLPASRNATAGVVVVGMAPGQEQQVTNLPQSIVSGTLDFAPQTATEHPEAPALPGLVMGRGLADALGVVTGERVALANFQNLSLTSAIMPYVRLFRVAGISETGFYEYDAAFVYIALEEAQKLFKFGDGVNGIAVRVDDRDRARAVADAIEEDLNGFIRQRHETSVASARPSAYFTIDWMQQHKGLFRWMTLEKWASFAILNLIILVAAFNIASTLIMVVLEKTKDIGILKSMGATSKSMMKVFIFQGSVVGICGTVIGCLIGFMICWLQATFKFIALPPDIYLIDALPIRMEWFDFVSVALGSMAISVLAAVYPAWRAAQLVPVEAIRYE